MINKVCKVAMTGELSVRISPNPTKSSVILQRDATGEVEILVMNSAGTVMYRSKANGNSFILPSAGWPAGLYRVSVKGNGAMETSSFVKE